MTSGSLIRESGKPHWFELASGYFLGQVDFKSYWSESSLNGIIFFMIYLYLKGKVAIFFKPATSTEIIIYQSINIIDTNQKKWEKRKKIALILFVKIHEHHLASKSKFGQVDFRSHFYDD